MLTLLFRWAIHALFVPLLEPAQVQCAEAPSAGNATVAGLGVPALHKVLLPKPVEVYG